MGVWIETPTPPSGKSWLESHPSWVCGLKLQRHRSIYRASSVTPLVGVWIETSLTNGDKEFGAVTPLVGVWIETLR